MHSIARGSNAKRRGRLVESAVGALSAIEVKDGVHARQSGMAEFLSRHPEAKRIVVGGSSSGAYRLDDFLHDRVPLFFWPR